MRSERVDKHGQYPKEGYAGNRIACFAVPGVDGGCGRNDRGCTANTGPYRQQGAKSTAQPQLSAQVSHDYECRGAGANGRG